MCIPASAACALAAAALAGKRVVHLSATAFGGGVAEINRVGHAFFKTRMQREGSLFGGEVSGHYYFRDFYCADSGTIPALMILELLSQRGVGFDELLKLGEENPAEPIPPKAEDLACIMYTSGSTGTPKGVMIKHRNVVAASKSTFKFVHHTLANQDSRWCGHHRWQISRTR